MNWPLNRAGNITPALEGQIPTRAEQAIGSAKDSFIRSDSWSWSAGVEADLREEMARALDGEDFKASQDEVSAAVADAPMIGGMVPLPDAGTSRSVKSARDLESMFARIKQRRQEDPGTYYPLPGSREEFDAELTRRRKKEMDDNAVMLGRGDSTVSKFAGGMAGALADEYSLPLLGIGAGAGSFARVVLTEGAINAAAEVPQVIKQRKVAGELGFEPQNPAAQIGTAFAAGAGFAAVLGGGARALDYVMARRQGESAALAAERAGFDGQVAVDSAEAALRSGQEVPNTPPQPNTPTELPPVTVDAPPGWAAIRGGIFAGESNGDFNALFGFSNRDGGPFANVKLTEMTVDQAIAFSAPDGAYAQWVKGQIGRVATPMGGYQIVGTTLRAVKKGLGLRGDELMTPALQERLGQWIYRAQGTGAWEGYRGPNADFMPPATGRYAGRADAPAGRRPFSTRFDEVATPSGTRVSVQYRVVDLGELRAASGDLQPRDRARAASDEQVAQMAARLDPSRLMPSPESDRGAPIIGSDMTVESGNGRVLALGRAATENPEAYAAYVDRIRQEFEIPEGVTRPVLVAERTSDLTPEARRAFVRESNTSAIARMAPSEQARLDADYLTARSFDAYQSGKGLNAPENVGFVRQMLGMMPQAERAALLTSDGRLNLDGIRRIRQSLFARAFDAQDLLKMVAETESPAVENLLRMLEDLAPDWAAFRSMVEAGYVRGEFDITEPLMEAVRMIAKARTEGREGQSVIAAIRDRLTQGDMFGDRNPMTAAVLDVFYKGDRARGPDAAGDILRRYAAEAAQVGRADMGDLLGDGVSPEHALARAVEGYETRSAYTPASTPADAAPAPPSAPIGDISEFDTARFSDGAESPAIERENAAIADDLRAELVPEIRADAPPPADEIKITLADGSQVSASALLRDLDDDQTLIEAMTSCALRGVMR